MLKLMLMLVARNQNIERFLTPLGMTNLMGSDAARH